MKESGAEVLSVLTDVSKASDVEVLAQKTLDAFGMEKFCDRLADVK